MMMTINMKMYNKRKIIKEIKINKKMMNSRFLRLMKTYQEDRIMKEKIIKRKL